METSLFKNWWLLTINGIAAIIFGLFAIFFPDVTLLVLIVYFGVLALFLGAFLMVGALTNRKKTDMWSLWLVEGVVNVVIGMMLLTYPEVSVKIFLVLLAIWAILLGAIQIISVVGLWPMIRRRWLLLLNGVLAIIFGVLIISYPFESAKVITVFIGAYTLVLGIFSIIISQIMRRVREDFERSTTETIKIHKETKLD